LAKQYLTRGSTLNLNIHFHMLFLDGVYLTAQGGVRVIGA
jgi:hypothetical protein